MIQAYTIGYNDATEALFGNRRLHTHGKFVIPFLKEDMKILDAGCGLGSITIDIAKTLTSGTVEGIDLEQSQINKAKERAHGHQLTNISLNQGDIYKLPFESESFDLVFTHGVLEHLDNCSSALNEIKRVLKPNGILAARHADWDAFIVAPNINPINQFVPIIKNLLVKNGCDPQFGRNQVATIVEAKFNPVHITASFDCWTTTPKDTLIASQFFAGYCASLEFKDQAVNAGIATNSEIESMIKAFKEWGTNPKAFAADAWTEVICRNAPLPPELCDEYALRHV